MTVSRNNQKPQQKLKHVIDERLPRITVSILDGASTYQGTTSKVKVHRKREIDRIAV